MRFMRYERLPFTWTTRKEKAVERRHRMEREALPLFAEQIANTQPGIEQIKTHRERGWIESEQEWRDARALKWRKVRRLYFSLADEVRHAVRADWNGRSMLPGDPWFLACVIQKHERQHGPAVAA